MLNVVAIMGRLVADPELRTTTNGTNVCRFRIACDRNFARQGEQRQADFIDIVAWRQAAEFVCKYFQKGSPIAIEGSLQTRQYQDKQGSNRTAVEVVASTISFAGPKAAEKPAVASFDQQAKNHEREANAAHSAPASEQSHQMGFSTQRQRDEWKTPDNKPIQSSDVDAYNQDDFAVISDDADLPF